MKVLLDELINMATQEEETEHKIGRSNKMNIKLTKKAKEELLKLVAGEITKINFTEMAVGDGLYTVAEATADIVALKSVRIKTKLGNIYEELVGGSSQLFITSTFYNKDIEVKFEVREVGIFAKSTDTDAEYLYAYYIVKADDMAIAIIQDKTTPQYIPISVNSKLSSIDEANITLIDDMLVVNQEEFRRYKVDAKEYTDIGDSSTLESAKEYADEHVNKKDNPHAVTKAQIGLGNVDNTADALKSVANLNSYNKGCNLVNGNNISSVYSHDNDGLFKLIVGNGATYYTKVDVANYLSSSNIYTNTGYSSPVTLPSGGTWFCKISEFHSNNGLVYPTYDRIVAGGTVLTAPPGAGWQVFAFRVV